MIDRRARNCFAEIGRQLVTGRLRTEEFEERSFDPDFLGESEDLAVRNIWEFFWAQYSDVWPPWSHRLVGRRRPSPRTRHATARAVVFLHTDLEYDAEADSSKFDESLWPFTTRSDFDRAKSQPQLLVGRA